MWQLTGTYVRNACAAGYKGLLQDGEYPSPDFCAALNSEYRDFVTEKLAHPIGQLGTVAGSLTAEASSSPRRGGRAREPRARTGRMRSTLPRTTRSTASTCSSTTNSVGERTT